MAKLALPVPLSPKVCSDRADCHLSCEPVFVTSAAQQATQERAEQGTVREKNQRSDEQVEFCEEYDNNLQAKSRTLRETVYIHGVL